ncbi:MAG: SRPBCC domain-containing protein [Solirubrobacteraceae bacterium]
MPTLNESFSVPNGQQSWAVVTDLNKLIPCVPDAKVLSADSPSKVQAEITVKMGAMSMVFTGPVEILSADGGTAKLKTNTREKGGQSNASGDVTISVSGNNVSISADAQISGKAASMGEGTNVAVLTQLVKSFADNLAKA